MVWRFRIYNYFREICTAVGRKLYLGGGGRGEGGTTKKIFSSGIISLGYKIWFSKWCKIQHFKIFFIFNIYSFIFNICIYSALLFVQNSTPIFIFNGFICSQNYYPFRNYLSIQQLLFIQDLLRISLTHGSDILPAVDEQGAAKKRKRSLEHWKDTDRFCTEFSEERLRRSEHLRLCLITLRRCSIDFLQIIVHNHKN